MLLNQEQIKNIREKKLTVVKNFTSFGGEHEPDIFDFNKLAHHLHCYHNSTTMWRDLEDPLYVPQRHYMLSEGFSVRGLEIREYFIPYISFLDSLFKHTPHQKCSDMFMHVSFTSYVGPAHHDNEDVFITALYGRTNIQTLPDKIDHVLEQGDMIYIPTYQEHKGFSVTPRIIMSMGMYNSCI